jgi:toxin ParE1/3/4
MPMPSYILSDLAESDLQKIIASTIKAWGNEKAKTYAESLESA